MRKLPLALFTLPMTVMIAIFIVRLVNPVDSDPDFYWHMKTGQYIVENMTLPVGDIFSYTADGRPWVLHEWLTEVIFFLVSRTFGLQGLWTLIAAVAAITCYLLFHLSRRFLANETHALLVTLLFYAPVVAWAAPRPQIFTYLIVAAYLHALFDFKYFDAGRRLVWLPPLMLLWANLHGAFLVGFVLIGLFMLSDILQLALQPQDKQARGRLISLAVTGVACLLATLVNPRFIEYWRYPFEVVNMSVSAGWISEWRSPDFHLPVYKYFLATFALYAVVLIYSRRKPDLAEVAVPGFFIFAGCTSLRHLPLASIALIPFCAMFVQHLSMPTFGIWGRAPRGVVKAASTQIDPRFVGILNVAVLIVVSAVVLSGKWRSDRETNLHEAMPIKAVDFIVSAGIKGRMFNNYGYGGYLIYRLFPDQKVFIDGRADMYGDAFVKQYIDIMGGRPDWKREFDRFDVDYAVLPREAPLRQLLMTEKTFRLVYDDSHHSVLVRDVERFRHLPSVSPAQDAARQGV